MGALSASGQADLRVLRQLLHVAYESAATSCSTSSASGLPSGPA